MGLGEACQYEINIGGERSSILTTTRPLIPLHTNSGFKMKGGEAPMPLSPPRCPQTHLIACLGRPPDASSITSRRQHDLRACNCMHPQQFRGKGYEGVMEGKNRTLFHKMYLHLSCPYISQDHLWRIFCCIALLYQGEPKKVH